MNSGRGNCSCDKGVSRAASEARRAPASRFQPYRDPGGAEGCADALQEVRQQTQQTRGQENAPSETADQTQHPESHVYNGHMCDQPPARTHGPDAPEHPPEHPPGPAQHKPAPRTSQNGAKPNSSVTHSSSTSAPSLSSSAGISTGLTRSKELCCRSEGAEPPPSPTNIVNLSEQQTFICLQMIRLALGFVCSKANMLSGAEAPISVCLTNFSQNSQMKHIL